MNIESFRTYCLSKPHATEHFPFDEDTLVFKIGDERMFALISLSEADRVNLKCDPERAIELRERFSAVQPGFHMSKKHWNTVFFNRELSDNELFELIDHSYDLVYKKLPMKTKKLLPL